MNDIKKREPKETDQQEVDKAILLLKDFIANNKQIEGNIWFSAMLSIFVLGYTYSGHSYDEFVSDIEKAKIHYKSWFEK